MNMKIIDLSKTWSRVKAETHRVKPLRDNILKREALLGLQILLGQYELAKSEDNRKLLSFYADVLKTYERHNINKCIIWEK